MDYTKVDEKRRRAKQRMGTGADLYKFREGVTKVLLLPSSRPDDKHPETEGIIWVEVCLHRDLGGGKSNMSLCLDIQNNPILSHPVLLEYARERKKDSFSYSPRQGCNVCGRLERGEIETALAKKNAPRLQWLFGFVPMWYCSPNDSDFASLRFEPVIYIAGNTIFKGFTDEISNLKPYDPTVFDAAVLMNVERVGTSFQGTDYDVRSDAQTVREPLRLDKSQRRVITEAVKPGGSCDLLKFAAKLLKSPQRLESLMAGIESEKDQAQDEPEQKACFGQDFQDDDECRNCSEYEPCAAMSGARPPARGTQRTGRTHVVTTDGVKTSERQPTPAALAYAPAPKDDEAMEQNHREAGADAPVDEVDQQKAAQGYDPVTGEVFDGEPEDGEDDGFDPASQACWATYDEKDEGCAECDLAPQCKVERDRLAAPAKAPSQNKAKSQGKKSEQKPPDKKPPEEATAAPSEPDEDEELAALAKLAEEKAHRSRKARPKS